MKPQEKVFFKDPIKLIQSRLENFSQVSHVFEIHALIIVKAGHTGFGKKKKHRKKVWLKYIDGYISFACFK